MKAITIKNKEILLVEVPEGAYNFRIGKTKITNSSLYAHGGYNGYKFELPSSGWRILGSGKADAITSEEWDTIVESYVAVSDGGHYAENWYKDYTDEQQIVGKDYSLTESTDSGVTLLSHHGYEVNRTVVLIKE